MNHLIKWTFHYKPHYMSEHSHPERGPAPEGSNSWDEHDAKWNEMVKINKQEIADYKAMTEEERSFAYTIIDTLKTAKTEEEFLEMCSPHLNQPPIKETVAVRSEEVHFPNGSYNFFVLVRPRRELRQKNEPIQYNFYYRKL